MTKGCGRTPAMGGFEQKGPKTEEKVHFPVLLKNNGTINEFIKQYGDKYDITLECCPFEVRMNGLYKQRQEEVAKFYEKFGFETSSKEEYPQEYQWEMIRTKK